jgi:hypothetical protein
VKRERLEALKGWFDDYVQGYLDRYDDPAEAGGIRLKREHTLRVCREIHALGGAVGLAGGDLVLAEAIGLLHDVGRFEQYLRHATFDDHSSVNHGRLGLNRIARLGLVKGLEREERRLVARSVAFHNAASLPPGEDERSLLFMRLIRDADKLDIWKVSLDAYEGPVESARALIAWGLPDGGCSPGVVSAILAGSIVRSETVRTRNDFKLLQVSWVFDLNFSFSVQAVLARRYVERVFRTLPRSDKMAAAERRVGEYMASLERVEVP